MYMYNDRLCHPYECSPYLLSAGYGAKPGMRLARGKDQSSGAVLAADGYNNDTFLERLKGTRIPCESRSF